MIKKSIYSAFLRFKYLITFVFSETGTENNKLNGAVSGKVMSYKAYLFTKLRYSFGLYQSHCKSHRINIDELKFNMNSMTFDHSQIHNFFKSKIS